MSSNTLLQPFLIVHIYIYHVTMSILSSFKIDA